MRLLVYEFLFISFVSTSIAFSADCINQCEDDYEKCIIPISTIASGDKTQHYNAISPQLNIKDINQYLKSNSFISNEETAHYKNREIYIITNSNSDVQFEKITLLDRCIKLNQKCRKKCAN